MRKKELIKKVEQLIDSMNSLQRELQIERQENKELKLEIENLKLKLENEKAKRAETKAVEVQPVALAPVNTTANAENNEGFVVRNNLFEETKEEEKNEEASPAPKKAEPQESEILKHGSVAIGTIVQESVRFTAIISATDNENKKELLSLIMGKGEMAKAEIFSIAQSDTDDSTKMQLIDDAVKETIDYFKSVAGQL